MARKTGIRSPAAVVADTEHNRDQYLLFRYRFKHRVHCALGARSASFIPRQLHPQAAPVRDLPISVRLTPQPELSNDPSNRRLISLPQVTLGFAKKPVLREHL